MKNEFIPYTLVLALKELGFDEKCLGFYHNEKPNEITFIQTVSTIANKDLFDKFYCSAPLYQQAFRFFREKYNLHEIVLADHKGKYDIIVGERISGSCLGQYSTYEEAELECLIKLIEIVKNDNRTN